MGRRRLIIVLAAFCAAGCMLTACGGDIGKINGVLLGERGASLEGEILGAGVRRPLSVAETGTFSYSSNSESQWVSVNETGIFYISEDVLCYYDYDTENRYALCSMPGCKHNDGDCNAYVGDMEWYGGYTLYDGEIYYLCKPAVCNYLELIRMDLTGRQKEIVTSIYAGRENTGEWRLSDVGQIYYYEDYVFLPVRWWKRAEEGARSLDDSTDKRPAASDEATQLLAVSLRSGCVTGVTELLVSRDNVMPGVDLLFFEEGQAVYGIDSFDGTKFVSEIRAFSPETGESESLWSGEMGSRGISAYREFYPMEVYHGKWLIEETSEEGEKRLCLYDPADGQRSGLPPENAHAKEGTEPAQGPDGTIGALPADDAEGGLVTRNYGGRTMASVIDGDRLLGYEQKGQDEVELYEMDLETGERKDLFRQKVSGEDNRWIFLEETSDRLIWKRNGDFSYYIVDKEDFEKRGLENSEEVAL